MSFLLSPSRRSRKSRLEIPPVLAPAARRTFSSSISRDEPLGLSGLDAELLDLLPRLFDLALVRAEALPGAGQLFTRPVELDRVDPREHRSGPRAVSAAGSDRRAQRTGRNRRALRGRRRRRLGSGRRLGRYRAVAHATRLDGGRVRAGHAPEGRLGECVDVGVDLLDLRVAGQTPHQRGRDDHRLGVVVVEQVVGGADFHLVVDHDRALGLGSAGDPRWTNPWMCCSNSPKATGLWT